MILIRNFEATEGTIPQIAKMINKNPETLRRWKKKWLVKMYKDCILVFSVYTLKPLYKWNNPNFGNKG